jgi:hypothetical protein
LLSSLQHPQDTPAARILQEHRSWYPVQVLLNKVWIGSSSRTTNDEDEAEEEEEELGKEDLVQLKFLV